MKLLFKVTLIALLFVVNLTTDCAAVTLDSVYLKTKITEDLNNKYAQNSDMEIIVKNVPTINIALQNPKILIDSSCDFSTKNKIKLAKVTLSQNGRVVRTITVPVEVVSYSTVLVATKDILIGETINSTNSTFEKRHIDNNLVSPIKETPAISNCVATKSINAGSIIDKRFLSKEVLVSRYKPLTAIFQSGGIRLTIEVTALENGSMGDYIKVKSSEYNKIYQGKVISSNQVLIQI